MVPRRRGHRAPHPRLHPLERGGDGRQGQQARRGHRRPPGDVRLLGLALRGRLQPLLPRQGRRHARRPGLLPGPRRARHLRPGLPRGPAERRGPRPLPPRDRPRRRGLSSYPHPRLMPDFWEFPTVSMGLGPINAHLPGPLQPLPAEPPHRRHQRQPGVVLPRRRRVRRARDARRHLAGRRASSSTTSSASSTATCSASTARCAATARSSRSSRPSSAAPAGTSSRSSGARSGTSCWPATSTASCSTR